MSAKALRHAARIQHPGFDLEHRITIMLIADRADNDWRFICSDDNALYSEMAAETTAVLARLRGDPLVRAGVDNARITRVVEALRDAQDEEK